MPAPTPTQAAFGLDFGTTNSSLARAQALPGLPPRVELAYYPARTGATSSFRSLLYFEQEARKVHTWSGPAAIERYLRHADLGDATAQGRLIQSLKSYLPSRTLTGTEIFGRRYLLEDLIARILRELREGAEQQFQEPIGHVVVGRPVHFVGSGGPEDDAFGVSRMRHALTLAGFTSVAFEFEPVAAAYAYQSTLQQNELLLIGDFGGGTSDFSLLRVGPGGRTLLGNAGVGLAGDAFDAKLVRKLVSPALGADSLARSMGSKLLPAVPAWIYANLERWHYLSFLRTRNVLEILNGARVRALEPGKIQALLTLIDEDLGYHLHQAVQRTKYALSSEPAAAFTFKDGSMNLALTVTRLEFESWIAQELRVIESTVDGLLAEAHVSRRQVDRVFLTGGSSFVPAVRRIFNSRFGEDRVRTGEAFTSVAYGLALRALASFAPG